jgi:hypothetical protein
MSTLGKCDFTRTSNSIVIVKLVTQLLRRVHKTVNGWLGLLPDGLWLHHVHDKVGSILQIGDFNLKPYNGHLVILQRLQNYHKTDLKVLSCSFLISQLLAHNILTLHGGLHHLLQLFATCTSRPQVYLKALDSLLGNRVVILELVLFSVKVYSTETSSDTGPDLAV